jgi:peptide/nickel transport system ATP-binding protein
MMANSGLLSVQDLSVTFRRVEPGGHVARIPVLRRVSLDIEQGEIVAVVGSSGAGKSILAHAILGVLPGNAEIAGRILFRGDELTRDRLAEVRGREIVLVPQSISFLDPLVKAKHAVQLAARRAGLDKEQAQAAQEDAFSRLGLFPDAGDRYPFELSGGMARRVLLAMATVGNPSLLVADEPTPGLHEEAVRESLSRLRRLADTGKSVLLISHDIVSCLNVADRVAVFLDGEVVEVAPAVEFNQGSNGLHHPYSRALWNALPQNAFTPEADMATVPSRPGRADGRRTTSIEDAHAEGA